ncbi:hypothetical protein PVAND_013621 [Polypedilum vanderplanki]|uniref:Uncharacterized protein n=1 Tax=Polypedilum vanderplanki TaxID=319348 RepID=A0A9J6CPZ2_POLVA|nr:hypothetical protein PVAND_013621 [Polypedilum vanderplanki]
MDQEIAAAAACSAQQKDKGTTATKDELQNFNDMKDNDEDLENNVVYSDSDDGDQFINSFEEEYDVQLSSPPSSRSPSNSDNDQHWYAYRGRWGINVLENQELVNGDVNNHQILIENRLVSLNNQQHNQQQNHHQQQLQEEDDFLEMDFEPDTNSEIEIENEARYANFELVNEHNNQLPIQLQQQQQTLESINSSSNDHQENVLVNNRITGTKPKQFQYQSTDRNNLKSPKSHQSQQHATYGDNVFKITGHLLRNENTSLSFKNTQCIDNDVYNVGASCSSNLISETQKPHHDSHPYNQNHSSHYHQDYNNLIKLHKSPSKSSNHNHKQQRLHEEQNDQFLFELEPIKSRNSVTIYTSNCDEKILMDALTSLKLTPDREIIKKYFNNSRPSPEMQLVDFIISSSKMKCNYLKLIELIKHACKNDDDEYGARKFDINFYPLDFFSTTPEMIDIEVSEIVKRWTPQTDLSPLVHIRNKYFVQTNVLGKLVNIIRRIHNQKSLASFKENETIKIPQFYVSGYITITLNRNPT